ncbi:argininosuccinate lyase [Ilyobacter polytropus]|uniref:Argininosuccinate lyase n=1 Tax=Ilyobacter polytropus (strain ATCC 51220 / DSM 2926 / LMG 16218 / CuHBu1) TaxID=572544 RepID=E3HAX9_ILYPC|nr:argininosuccinate lyase [Ilyobacter polytropus]ADO82128.1 argininosuccinate lyase [Ilyobacter polytropus DSM 2926]
MKLWGGRFKKETSSLLEKFNASINFDKRMYKEDIEGSIAHSKMLAKQDIISHEEQKTIEKGLLQVKEEIESGNFVFSIKDEDIHMAIEGRLIALVGEAGKKLHTARSRNDQVLVDTRLYTKRRAEEIGSGLLELMDALIEVSEKNIGVIMPGYTHLQRAQPILFSHHVMAYFQMFKRDLERLESAVERIDVLPLGAGALAGTTYPIDREYVRELLGFAKVSENSLDTVSDRDFIIEMNFVLAMIAMHMSRFSEEIIMWSTKEFSFVQLDDGYSTGSSIMPQKKNPDIPELVRGKCGRVYGNLVSIMTVMKGLPLAYNKDTQEDKEGFFDSVDNMGMSLEIFKEMLLTMSVNEENMKKGIYGGFINATDVADYLAKKGIPFREAHHITGSMVAYCEEKNTSLEELSLEEFKQFSDAFESDVLTLITVEACIEGRDSYGGTSTNQVKRQISEGKKLLEKYKGEL